VLQRLEDKGLVKSEMSEPNGERGGRRKSNFLSDSCGKTLPGGCQRVAKPVVKQDPKVALQFTSVAIQI
jgi:PadR family transcriptional regulator, regulatory protein PadR